LPPQIHPWGLFDPGAWKLVRIQTDNFNDRGAVSSSSTSDSKTTLLDIDDKDLSLEVKVCVELAGKRFDNDPQTLKQGFHGEVLGPSLKIKELPDATVAVEERKIPCQVREIEWSDANGKTVSKIYYSATVAPYLLKKESTTTDAEGKSTLSETSVTVQALDMPCKILGCLHGAAYIKTMQKTPKGTVVTLAVACPDVPGGIISYSSKELDTAGRLVRRSTLELVSFSTEPEKDRMGVFRKRAARHRGKTTIWDDN
jgi:hypothetical protein